MSRKDAFGLSITVFGSVLLVWLIIYYWSVPLISLASSFIILGLAVLNIPLSTVPKETIRSMLESSALSVEAILEELDVSEKSIFVKVKEGLSLALIPISGKVKDTSELLEVRKLPIRTVMRLRDLMLALVVPPGSRAERFESFSRSEDSIAPILSDDLEIAEDVKVVKKENIILVSFKPRVELDLPRFNKSLGGLQASVAGCVLASIFGCARLLRSDKNMVIFEVTE